MSNFYTSVIRPGLFCLEPERVHGLVLQGCSMASHSAGFCGVVRSRMRVNDPALKQTIGGIEFENPVGLAAGLDKNGVAVRFLGSLGFGHVEIGSISAYPSRGNPRPRLFRIPTERGIVVNYGVPNDGAIAVAKRLGSVRCPVPLGINLVKTNDPARPASDEEVLHDYTTSFVRLQSFASYMNLNMSCPNSANDRNHFDDLPKINDLLEALRRENPKVPVFLKLKPNADRGWVRDLVGMADSFPFIAGFGINLPAGKPEGLKVGMARAELAKLPGAVSGKPVEDLINANLKLLREVIGPRSRYRLVAAGGVFTGDDVYRKIRLGASLVQLYTAMVYEGPGIVRPILHRLQELLTRDGFARASDAVGADVPPVSEVSSA